MRGGGPTPTPAERVSRARRSARPGVAARPPAHGVSASRGCGGASDSRALPEYSPRPACDGRLMRCVPRTVRSGARLRRSSLGGVCRGDPPCGLSGMVRVSEVPHWTKSAGTIPPYKAVGPVLLEAGHAWGWCASAWAHGGPGGAVSPRGEESGMRGHLGWYGVRWLSQDRRSGGSLQPWTAAVWRAGGLRKHS